MTTFDRFTGTLLPSVRRIGALLNGRRNEALAVIYLNAENRLIDEGLWEGTIDRISFHPCEIMRKVILLDPSGILIPHNHPSGDPTPSHSDLKNTAQLEMSLDLIDVVMIDHIIFGE